LLDIAVVRNRFDAGFSRHHCGAQKNKKHGKKPVMESPLTSRSVVVNQGAA
jgi:hypothetical protein